MLSSNNVTFKVPKFQRNYSWKREDAMDLWTDLMGTFMTVKDEPALVKDAQYLIGSIVLVPDDKSGDLSIIDGQQRLATLTLLFCVARDVMFENMQAVGKQVEVDPILKSMIENTHIGKRRGWKLVLNDTDKEVFEEIQEYECKGYRTQKERFKKEEAEKSAKLLKDNYVFLHDCVSKALANGFKDSDPESDDLKSEDLLKLRVENIPKLISFISCVVEYNFVVKIEVPDDATAYQVFESLNARGEVLTGSNLIKTYILKKVSNDQNKQVELNQRWNKIFGRLGKETDDVFIFESYRSRHFDPKASKKNLYKTIQKKIPDDDPNKCEDYVKELEDDIEFISQLNCPETYYDSNTQIEIDALAALDAKLFRIPVMAAHRRWKFNKDYKTIVVALVKFFFKFRVVRRKHPGEVEKVMLEWTRMINDGSRPEQILDDIRKNDDHGHFVQEFGEFIKSPPPKVAKYILQQITAHMKSQYDDVKPISKLTLEHILPQKYAEWDKDAFFKDYNGQEDMGDFVGRLGNLTLLKDSINTKLKNKEFYEKKNKLDKEGKAVGYISSKLEINIETVCKKDEWTAKVIEEREKLFVEYARKIWLL